MRTLRLIVRPWVVISLLLIVAGLHALTWLGRWSEWFSIKEPAVLLAGTLTLWVGAYGVYRAIRFHPRLRPGYSAWLRSLPWSPPDPLPLGPVHLVWVDALVIAVVGVLLWVNFDASFAFVVKTVAGMTLVGMAFYCLLLLAASLRQAAHLTLVLALMPLALYPQPRLEQALVAAAAIYLVLWHAMRRELVQLPWELMSESPRERYFQDAAETGLLQGLLLVAGPDERKRGRTYTQVVVIAALLAWWFHVLLSVMVVDLRYDWDDLAKSFARPGVHSFLRFVWTSLFVGLAACRLFIYLNGHLPPINRWGRLLRGRWIIPRYDVVFVAPALTVLFGIWGPKWLYALGTPPQMLPAVSVFTLLCIAVGLGPRRHRWQWLAPHRLVPPYALGKPAPQRSRDEVVIRITVD